MVFTIDSPSIANKIDVFHSITEGAAETKTISIPWLNVKELVKTFNHFHSTHINFNQLSRLL